MANIIQSFLGYLKLNDEDDLDDYDEYEEGLNERESRRERANREKQREERRSAKNAKNSKRRMRYNDLDDDVDDIAVSRTSPRGRMSKEESPRETSSRYSSSRSVAGASGTRMRSEEPLSARSTSAATASAPVEESTARTRTTRMERTATNKVVPIRTTSRGFEVCIIKPTAFEDAQDVCDMLLGNRAVILNLESIEQSEAQRIIDFVCGCVYAINGKLHSVARYIFIFSPASVDISGDFAEFFQEAGFGVPKFSKDF